MRPGLLWLTVCFLLTFKVELGFSVCSCSDSTPCGPIRGKDSKNEVLGFTMGSPDSGYQQFDWNKLTTIVLVQLGTPATNDIICMAHTFNVKVQILVHFSSEQLVNTTFRQIFINETVQMVQKNNLDGVNMDYEDSVTPAAYSALNLMMQQLRAALKNANPLYGLSMDYVFCAYCWPNRTFDIVSIKNYIDFFILMDYDMEGHLINQRSSQASCYKLYNSPLPAVISGMKSFLDAGIPASQLVLAFPWYGDYYTCEPLDPVTNRCYVNCSTRFVGQHQILFRDIMVLLRSGPYQRMWSDEASTPFFNYKNTDGSTSQMNYDDTVSLNLKYNVVKTYSLRGLGIWTIDFLDYTNKNYNATVDKIEMWNALPGGN